MSSCKLLCSLVIALGLGSSGCTSLPPATKTSNWPAVASPIKKDPMIEARIAGIVAGMTLAQKVGQMTQAEIQFLKPDEVRQYYLGSVLNGGGSWPAANKRSTVTDWVVLADQFHDASMQTDMKVPVPLIWGTDAVHGHNNVMGATLFPHNIGLGATHDAALVHDVAVTVGKAVRATGIHWVFGPTLAVAQDDRWGRTYESFSEDPAVVRRLGFAYVNGLQHQFGGDDSVVATAKHFIGDGATDQGKDQGVAKIDLATMINTHAQGYLGAIEAGVQTVMASFNSWNDIAGRRDYGTMHGSTLLTELLKEKWGFDGFVVTDWNGIKQVPGCSNTGCAHAINAGIDMVMVPEDWKAFIGNTIAQVERGEIPMSRIDDAVSRILRVKIRAGLFERKPSQNANAGRPEMLLARDLAREAVRKSVVLLKNNQNFLPLKRSGRYLVVGKSANSIAHQTGGWSLSWQGTTNSNSDFPYGDTILAGIREVVGGDNVVFSANGSGIDPGAFDAVIAVIGENPYAEMLGDIGPSGTLHHGSRYPEDLRVLNKIVAAGKPVVTVFIAGRPLYVNDIINQSDAFVMAWLPGTEGKGVADVLFRKADNTAPEILGRLPFSWPREACQTPLNFQQSDYAPLFPLGYGLTYQQMKSVGSLEHSVPQRGCGNALVTPIFNQSPREPFQLFVSTQDDDRDAVTLDIDPNVSVALPSVHPAIHIQTAQINTQQDAKRVTWSGRGKVVARAPEAGLLAMHANADSTLEFDMLIHRMPDERVVVGMACDSGCLAQIDMTDWLRTHRVGVPFMVKIPLGCFIAKGADMAQLVSPFMVKTGKAFEASFTNINLLTNAAKDADALRCTEIDSDLR